MCSLFLGCKTIENRGGGSATVAKDALMEKYWKLIELDGKGLTVSDSNRREPHLILKKEGAAVTGSSGCNSFSGTYELTQKGITFSQMIATRMACPDMTVEKALLQLFSEVDSYTISSDGKFMTLLNGAKELAKFEVVYLE